MRILVLSILFIVSMVSHLYAEKILVVTEDWPPYNYIENNKITGISTQIVEMILKEAGIDYEIKVYPWARAFEIAKKQKNVLIYSIRKSDEREPFFKWICPILPEKNTSLYKLKKRKDIQINSLEDAKKHMIGLADNSIIHKYFKDHGFVDDVNLDPVTKNDNNFLKLINNRVDLIVSHDLTMISSSREHHININDFEEALFLFKGKALSCMAFNINTSDEIIKRVQIAFEHLQSKQFIERVIENYKSNQSNK